MLLCTALVIHKSIDFNGMKMEKRTASGINKQRNFYRVAFSDKNLNKGEKSAPQKSNLYLEICPNAGLTSQTGLLDAWQQK